MPWRTIKGKRVFIADNNITSNSVPNGSPTLKTGRIFWKKSDNKIKKEIEFGAYAGIDNLIPKAGIYGKVKFSK